MIDEEHEIIAAPPDGFSADAGVLYVGGRLHGWKEVIDGEVGEEKPVSQPLLQRPDVNGLIDYLLGAREAFRAAGGDIEGTLSISGPVAITIDL